MRQIMHDVFIMAIYLAAILLLCLVVIPVFAERKRTEARVVTWKRKR